MSFKDFRQYQIFKRYENAGRYPDGYYAARFHFRLQTAVLNYYRTLPNSFSNLCNAAIERFYFATKEGRINTKRISRFLGRDDMRDKVECIVRIELGSKDFIEKLAIALRVSQAEVLRMALEWWMEAVCENKNRAVNIPALRKWHHRVNRPHLDSLNFSFWKYGCEVIWKYHEGKPPSFAGH